MTYRKRYCCCCCIMLPLRATTSYYYVYCRVVNEGGPAPRRPANRLITDYDPNVARRVRSLARRRATSRDPELIALAADVIDAPPINDAPYKMFKLLETPQSKEVDRLLGRMASTVLLVSVMTDSHLGRRREMRLNYSSVELSRVGVVGVNWH